MFQPNRLGLATAISAAALFGLAYQLQPRNLVSMSWNEASLSGVTLGMSQEQVLQRWGEPDLRNAPALSTPKRRANSICRWTWERNREQFVDFDSKQHVVIVGAEGALKSGEHVVAEGWYKTTCSDVSSLLGQPNAVIRDETDYTDRAFVYNGPGNLELVVEMGCTHGVFSTILGQAAFFPPPNPMARTWWYSPGHRLFTQSGGQAVAD